MSVSVGVVSPKWWGKDVDAGIDRGMNNLEKST